jgi:hypothetical protein
MRRPVLLTVTMTAVLLLAGCNSDGTMDLASEEPTTAATAAASEPNDPAALQAVTDAAAATADQDGATFTITVATEGTPGEDGIQPISAQGEEDFASQQRTVTLSSPAGDLRAIVDGTDIYVQLPGTEEETWARANLDELIAGDVGFGGPAGLPFRSSTDNLMVLRDAVVHASAGEEEDLDGQAATRYDLTVDLEQAAQEAADANDTMAAVAEQSGLTRLDMQVWVGEDSNSLADQGTELIRRVSYSLDLSQADIDAATEAADVDAEPTGVVTVTIDYADFGAHVRIELPDDSQVVDLDEDAIRDSLTVPSTATPAAPSEAAS